MGFDASLEMRENVDSLLMPALFLQENLADDETTAVRFDAILTLNARLCRTHVVLFVRYWVSATRYHVAVVWAEPHAGSLNFPIYPPTLTLASDPNQFIIAHQFQHMYDASFDKPLGRRGPFGHRFNSYALSDIRFAVEEIRDLGLCANNAQRPEGDASTDCAKLSQPSRRCIVLPERPITVSFGSKGPTITIAGETRQYSELETLQYEGGRQCIVDYEPVKIGEALVSMPTRISVSSGDAKRGLRSALLCNYTGCAASAGQTAEDARSFSGFDANDMRCRELLLKYWMKPYREITPADVNSLHALRAHFSEAQGMDMSLGTRLKRVNALLQVDWMLHDAARLENDFRTYLSLLSGNDLHRMILFGGRNIIETTVRWGQFRAGGGLLALWLDAAVARNDLDSLLDFASASLDSRGFWTTAKLMERAVGNAAISREQRFIAQAYRCLALSQICQIVNDPERTVGSELDITQVGWALAHQSPESLLAECRASLGAAREAWKDVARPSRQHSTLKSQLNRTERTLFKSRSTDHENEPAEIQ